MDQYQAFLAGFIVQEGIAPGAAELLGEVLLREGVEAAKQNAGMNPAGFVQITPEQLARIVARSVRAVLAAGAAPQAPANPFAAGAAAPASPPPPAPAPAPLVQPVPSGLVPGAQFTMGRSRGMSPVHTPGPPSGPNSIATGSTTGPRVEVRDASGQITASGLVSSLVGQSPGPAAAALPQNYQGQLQPGQQLVTITGADGAALPPVLIDKGEIRSGQAASLLLPQGSPLAASPVGPPPAPAAPAAPLSTVVPASSLATQIGALRANNALTLPQLAQLEALATGNAAALDVNLIAILVAKGLARFGAAGVPELTEAGAAVHKAESDRLSPPAPPTLAPPPAAQPPAAAS